MRETRADTARAFVFALGLHVLLFAFLIGGLWWTRAAAPEPAAGSIAAEVVDASALSAAMRRTIANRPEPRVEPEPLPPPEPEPEPAEEDVPPPPQPQPEPRPQEAPTPPQRAPQDFIPQPDDRNQQAVVETPTPTPAEEKKVQEAKRKQEQVDLTEQRKRQEEAERQQRLAKMEEERLKQLADLRKRRTAAQREAELAEQKLRQIADARAQAAAGDAAQAAERPSAGNEGTSTDLRARYAAALQEAIRAKWIQPENVAPGQRCVLVIRQLPGGEVMSAEVGAPCAYDEAAQRSIEAAVLKAQPLPYAGFESVFSRELTLNFVAD